MVEKLCIFKMFLINQVRKCDVIVCNRTSEYAVGLRKSHEMAYPVVTLRKRKSDAKEAVELAKTEGTKIVEDGALARYLYVNTHAGQRVKYTELQEELSMIFK